MSWATWLLFTSVPAWCVALLVPCPGPLGSRSPVCPLGALLCVCGVLGHWTPVHRCARLVCWLCVRCPGPLGSCSPVCLRGLLCCVCAILGHLAPVHRCARSVRCFACAVSWATWLLFTGVAARCVACVLAVLGHLAPVHRCARWACCVACAVSWTTWLLFTGVPARCAVSRVRCPGPIGSCSPVCPLGALLCLCGFLGHLAPVHRCARSVCCFACAVSWATWLLFTGSPARCAALRVCCPGPLGSYSPVCPLGALPVCAVSWATWLLFTGVPAWCVALLVRCPGPLGSCSPVCPLGVLCCVCGVLGPSAPVHRCACSVCCLRVRCPGPLGFCSPVCPLDALPVCAVSWATWLLFTGVPAWCVALFVRCPGALGSCSLVCSPGVLCGVLGHLAPVPWCARSVCSAVRCVCGAALRGAHSSIRTVAIRSRQGLGTLRARTRPSGRRLFVAGRGWVPSGRTSVHRDGGCSVADRGWCCLAPVLVPLFVACCARFPGLRHPAAVAAWHLSVCRGCGRRRASLACLVAPRGAPRLVRSGRSRCSGRLSRRCGAFPHPYIYIYIYICICIYIYIYIY